MKNLNKVTKLLLLLIVVINFTACKKECSKCIVREPDLIKDITYNLNDKSIQKEFMIYQMSIENGYYREYLGQTKFDESFFDFLKEYCLSKNIPVNEKTMDIVLYYNSPISQTLKVSDENIQGISIFGVEKKKIMHHLFIKNEKSEFYEEENTKVPIRYVTHNHIRYYLENYVFKNPQNKSYIITSGKFATEVEKNIKKYHRAPLFRFEVNTSAKDVGHPSGEEHPTCGDPCPLGAGGCLIRTDIMGQEHSECVTDPCSSREAQTILLNENMGENIYINLGLMYSFRDDFLYMYEKGENYIEYYYYLSEEYQGKISISLALQSALFLKDFNSVLQAFLNPENHLTEIMFTEELTESLLDLLDEYEKITSTDEGKEMLTSIRADINSFKNKQLQEILEMIN